MREDILIPASRVPVLVRPTRTAAQRCTACGASVGDPCTCGWALAPPRAQIIHIRVIELDEDIEEMVVLGDCSGCGSLLSEHPSAGFPARCPACGCGWDHDAAPPVGVRAICGSPATLHLEQ
jgi:hypothetical protein